LHFIGTVHVGHLDHYYNLQRKAEGLPIKFHANAGPDVLSDLLSRAIIYWHATGFEIDPNVSPEKCEHFGISVLEAMAAGCVPLVVSNGGPTEFVREKETGFQYSTIEELVSKTKQILEDPLGLAAISAAAVGEAQRFSEAVFIEKWRRIGGSQQIFSVHRPA
jgi:glycosyltransferase involved in cell wall biosynthesis